MVSIKEIKMRTLHFITYNLSLLHVSPLSTICSWVGCMLVFNDERGWGSLCLVNSR